MFLVIFKQPPADYRRTGCSRCTHKLNQYVASEVATVGRKHAFIIPQREIIKISGGLLCAWASDAWGIVKNPDILMDAHFRPQGLLFVYSLIHVNPIDVYCAEKPEPIVLALAFGLVTFRVSVGV